MSSNRMLIKENNLQLLPQFSSTRTSKNASETKMNLVKIGKYVTHNNNI